ncbi:MAG TPA: type II secretion system protein [Burkholderiales bacterium]|nr:type II secretion system protein [Burkholderiales bacterium]
MTASSASRPDSRRSRQRGFTLTELAVVFTIVVLLLGSLMYTLSAQMESRNIGDTQRRLEEARELVLAFAIVNGRLPCPASLASNSGDESPAGTGLCTDGYTGYLPARAIGFTPTDVQGYGVDVWGNRIRYAVSINSNVAGAPDYTFTKPPVSPGTGIKYNFNAATGTSATPSDLLVCTAYGASGSLSTSTPSCGLSTDSPIGLSATNQNTVVAVVWSQGKNFNTASFGGVAGQASGDEAFNNKTAANSNHGVFVHHPPRTPFDGNEYDDQVAWISVNLLYGRMVAAGILP